MLKRSDKHLAKKQDELALETIRALRNALEGRPVTISQCHFQA